MPKGKEFYVLNLDKTLSDTQKRMKSYNRRYLRDFGTVIKAEKGLLSRDNLDRFSQKELKEMILQRIKKGNLTDPIKTGKLAVMCVDNKVRYYKPDVWAETIARTRSRALQEEGLHNKMVKTGFDLVQVSIGGSGDPCTNWEGRTLSITGNTPGYPTVDEAQGSKEVFHPRCVHSTFPIVIDQKENLPAIWEKPGIPIRVQNEIKDGSLTQKLVVPSNTKINLNNPPTTAVSISSGFAIETISEAIIAAKLFSDKAAYSKGMNVDGLQSSIVAVNDVSSGFDTEGLKFFGANEKASTLFRTELSREPDIDLTTNKGNKAIVFNTAFTKDDDVRSIYQKKSITLNNEKGRYNINSLKEKDVSPIVIERLEKRNLARKFSIISEIGGTKALVYKTYGEMFKDYDNFKEGLAIAREDFKNGWPYLLGENTLKGNLIYFKEAFSAYMLGQSHLISKKLNNFFKGLDKRIS